MEYARTLSFIVKLVFLKRTVLTFVGSQIISTIVGFANCVQSTTLDVQKFCDEIKKRENGLKRFEEDIYVRMGSILNYKGSAQKSCSLCLFN